MIPTYEITNYHYTEDGHFVRIARLTCECTNDDLSKLMGIVVDGKKIIAVDMIGGDDQSFAIDYRGLKYIGLMLEDK